MADSYALLARKAGLGSRMGERRSALETGEVAKRSNAADCKSVALAASEVRILPSPPTFAARGRNAATVGKPAFVASDASGCETTGERACPAEAPRCRGRRDDMQVGLPRRSAAGRREGGSNSVVESQPSKLLVAGSIPVSRSRLRPTFAALTATSRQARVRETRRVRVMCLRLAVSDWGSERYRTGACLAEAARDASA